MRTLFILRLDFVLTAELSAGRETDSMPAFVFTNYLFFLTAVHV